MFLKCSTTAPSRWRLPIHGNEERLKVQAQRPSGRCAFLFRWGRRITRSPASKNQIPTNNKAVVFRGMHNRQSKKPTTTMSNDENSQNYGSNPCRTAIKVLFRRNHNFAQLPRNQFWFLHSQIVSTIPSIC